ncbi:MULTISPECIES: cation:proton antiporter [Xanthobacter]|uniref:cation:proton antiporter n=2 Tax=Xanthobacter TaxID=279 RepID=UPI00372CC552
MMSALQEGVISAPFLQIALIILACHLSGTAFLRCGQPRVIGEIAAGILLGPFLMLMIGEQLHALVFPVGAQGSLGVLGEMGLVLLLFQVGLRFEAAHMNMRGEGRTVIAVAIAGVVLSFGLGAGVGVLSHTAIAPGQPKAAYVLFCGVALSITALPVLARIIADLDLEGTAAGRLGIAAAAVTDIIGWLMLATIAAWAAAGSSPEWAAGRLTGALVILGLVAWGARKFMRRLHNEIGPDDGATSSSAVAAVMLSFALLFGWLTSQAGLHGALGGLLAGVVLREQRHHWQSQMEGFVNLALVPLYFASAGLKMEAGDLAPLDVWPWFVAFLTAAIVGKAGGGYLAARWSGLPSETAGSVAILMNARGLVEIIVLSVGLDLGLISPTAFFVLLLVAITTTLMTTPLLKLFNRRKFQAASLGEQTP